MSEELKKYASLSVWCTLLVFIVRCSWSWKDIVALVNRLDIGEIFYGLFGYAGEAVGVSAFIMILFDRFAWKWPIVNLLHDRPILFSEYHGVFVSDYDHRERKGTLRIRQTFLSLNIVFKTDESKSLSINGEIIYGHGTPMLVYTYHNAPKAEIHEISPIHYGTAMLDISNTAHIEGNYFTGRGTRGSMSFDSCEDFN